MDTQLLAGFDMHGAARPGMKRALPGKGDCHFTLSAGSAYILCQLPEVDREAHRQDAFVQGL